MQPLSLACRRSLSSCVFTWSSLSECQCPKLHIKTSVILDYCSSSSPHCNLVPIWTLSSNTVTFWGSRGSDFNIWTLVGGRHRIQFITARKRFRKHVSWLVKGNGSVMVPWGPCTHPHRTQARLDLLLNLNLGRTLCNLPGAWGHARLIRSTMTIFYLPPFFLGGCCETVSYPFSAPMMHETFCLVLRLLGPVAACKLAAAWHQLLRNGLCFAVTWPFCSSAALCTAVGSWCPCCSSVHCTCKQSELGLVVSLPIVSTRTYLVLTLWFGWQEAQMAWIQERGIHEELGKEQLKHKAVLKGKWFVGFGSVQSGQGEGDIYC